MTEGLITRIGQWLDRKWEAKATESQLDHVLGMTRDRWNSLENAQIRDKIELEESIKTLRKAITDIDIVVKAPSEAAKEIADLKTRLEKIELYAGMTRKVDPTKPAIAKSAFSM